MISWGICLYMGIIVKCIDLLNWIFCKEYFLDLYFKVKIICNLLSYCYCCILNKMFFNRILEWNIVVLNGNIVDIGDLCFINEISLY